MEKNCERNRKFPPCCVRSNIFPCSQSCFKTSCFCSALLKDFKGELAFTLVQLCMHSSFFFVQFRHQSTNSTASFGHAPGSMFWKNGGNFVDRVNKNKLRTLYAFPIFLVSSNILTSLMESWCIVFVGNNFFWTKLT